MIGEAEAAPAPAPAQDIVAELTEWIGRGAVPLEVAKRALEEIGRLRAVAGAVSIGIPFSEIKSWSPRARA